MLRLLYVSSGKSVHHRNFLSAWSNAGIEVLEFNLHDKKNMLRELTKVITNFKPDLIQSGPLCDIAPLVRKVWGGPFIATSWGFDLVSQIHESTEAYDNCIRILDSADAILVDNLFTEKIAIDLGAQIQKISRFPWGVDLETFVFSTSREQNQELSILSLRNHEEIYNIEHILRAFKAAVASKSNLRLLLAGSGSCTAKYKEFIAENKLYSHVELLGEVNNKDLPQLFKSSDLYVSASLVDGSSVTLLEAMACGIPVAVSDIPGNREWVTEETGQIFSLSKVDELSKIFINLTEEQFKVNSQSQIKTARRLVEMKADWSSVPDKLRQLAENIVSPLSSN